MSSDNPTTVGEKLRHLAVIMDGNRRWAKIRGLPREFGHRRGADNLHHLCNLCTERGIRYLTVYAFSTENWKRTEREVSGLMRLFILYFNKYSAEMAREGVRLRFMGDRPALPKALVATMEEAETTSKERSRLQLIIAFNYGGRRELTEAVRMLAGDAAGGTLDPDAIDESSLAERLYLPDVPDPDLIIRTGGERRLSNFLLWQAAYAELYFDDTLWPDFDAPALDRAIDDFMKRQRRFGSS